jgi:hypothetical protein
VEDSDRDCQREYRSVGEIPETRVNRRHWCSPRNCQTVSSSGRMMNPPYSKLVCVEYRIRTMRSTLSLLH